MSGIFESSARTANQVLLSGNSPSQLQSVRNQIQEARDAFWQTKSGTQDAWVAGGRLAKLQAKETNLIG